MKEMRTWLISDTHGQHETLFVPPAIELVIHAGDESNSHSPAMNNNECRDFLTWYGALPIPHKIFIAGNHSAAIYNKLVKRSEIEALGIHYLEHESLSLGGRTFFGSPYTPTFGDWYFMKNRGTISREWEDVHSDLDVLITHGPPKGILDITTGRDGLTEHVGDFALLKAVIEYKPRYHVFGHIHNGRPHNINSGVFSPGGMSTTFINASVVRDGQISEGAINNGYIIEI